MSHSRPVAPSDDGTEVRARFAGALATEPPFATPDGAALDAAVRDGRRRHTRAVATRGLTLATAVVVVGGAVVLLRPVAQPGPVVVIGAVAPSPVASMTATPPPVASSPVASPMPVPHPSGSAWVIPVPVPSGPAPAPSAAASVDAATTYPRLESLVTSLVAATGGRVVSVEPQPGGGLQGPGVFAHVSTAAGAYDLDVSMSLQSYLSYVGADPASTCRPVPTDNKPCIVVGTAVSDFMESVPFSDGSGRTDFLYVADAGSGRSLLMNYTNYTAQGSAAKNVGPSWTAAGYRYPAIHAAVQASGLLG
jgi:hypothetical protein